MHATAPRPRDWLTTRKGLYCEPGDFYIDPTGAVDRAVITHGHGDHARPNHRNVLATAGTLAIMRARFGAEAGGQLQSAAYGERIRIGEVGVTLAPAGHILGSAQIVLDYRGTKLLHSLQLFPERCHVIGVYALGKCQRVLTMLRRQGYDEPIYLHGALIALCDLYGAHGVVLGPLLPCAGVRREALKGRIVLAPPGATNDRWARKLPDVVVGMASGWMRVRQRAKARGVELPLVISDHADWDELVATLDDVGAPEIWVTHGREEALIHQAQRKGLDARALSLVGFEEED